MICDLLRQEKISNFVNYKSFCEFGCEEINASLELNSFLKLP